MLLLMIEKKKSVSHVANKLCCVMLYAFSAILLQPVPLVRSNSWGDSRTQLARLFADFAPQSLINLYLSSLPLIFRTFSSNFEIQSAEFVLILEYVVCVRLTLAKHVVIWRIQTKQ